MSDVRVILKQVNRLFSRQNWIDYEDAALLASRLISGGRLSTTTVKELPVTFFTFNQISRSRVLEVLKSVVVAQDSTSTGSIIDVLLLSASPNFANGIRVDKELRGIIKRVRASTNRDQLNLNILPATEPGDIIDELNRIKPSILQISSHGEVDGLLLDGNSAQEGTLTAGQLKKIIATTSSVKIVILNSCYSFKQAQSLTSHVDIAIGMAQAIGDAAAIAFSGQFYSSLAEGVSVKDAFDQALVNINLTSSTYTDIPKIYSAKGIKPDNYFVTH